MANPLAAPACEKENQVPPALAPVWRPFRDIPCESLTKGWWYGHCDGAPYQRSVAEMEEHRRRYGTGGNCFDLALWLRAALTLAGIDARIIGHDYETADAHAAVLATDDQGREWLCDPGDQWLAPVLAAADPRWQDGCLLGRSVQIHRSAADLRVLYRRAGGYAGQQDYSLAPLDEAALRRACHHSQNLLRRPFCEALIPHPAAGDLARWEYTGEAAFWHLADGTLQPDHWPPPLSGRSGIAPPIIAAALAAYARAGFTGRAAIRWQMIRQVRRRVRVGAVP